MHYIKYNCTLNATKGHIRVVRTLCRVILVSRDFSFKTQKNEFFFKKIKFCTESAKLKHVKLKI
jgi:hypothetical protein